MQVQLVGDRLLIKRDVAPEKTKTGVIYLESNIPVVNTGVVLEVGHKVEVVKKNNRVQFGPHALLPISIGDDEYFILRENEVIAILLD
jgi:chaperonin GroES